MTPRLPLPEDATASPELRAAYAAARERTGSVMAILRAMGPRAEVVEAFVAFADAALYGPAALGRRERELVAVTVSRANGAAYSRRVHERLLAELGGNTGARRTGRSSRSPGGCRPRRPRRPTRSRTSARTSPTTRCTTRSPSWAS